MKCPDCENGLVKNCRCDLENTRGCEFCGDKDVDVCTTCDGTGIIKRECPCDDYSQTECAICEDNKFSDTMARVMKIVWDQKEVIRKLKYDNGIMESKLKIIKTMAILECEE